MRNAILAAIVMLAATVHAPPQKTFEMNLKRVGDSDWPLGKPIPPSVAK